MTTPHLQAHLLFKQSLRNFSENFRQVISIQDWGQKKKKTNPTLNCSSK